MISAYSVRSRPTRRVPSSALSATPATKIRFVASRFSSVGQELISYTTLDEYSVSMTVDSTHDLILPEAELNDCLARDNGGTGAVLPSQPTTLVCHL